MNADQLLQFIRIPKQVSPGARVSYNSPFTLDFPTREFSYSVSQTEGDTDDEATIHVLVGPDNKRDWRPLARIEGPYLRSLRPGEAEEHFIPAYRGRGSLKTISPQADSFKALAWAWKAANHGDLGPVRALHSGQCSRCHRRLTRADSIDRGIGPLCWEKLQAGKL